MAQLKLNVVLFDGETMADMKAILTHGHEVECTVESTHSHRYVLTFTGEGDVLRSIKRRYADLDENIDKLVDKPVDE